MVIGGVGEGPGAGGKGRNMWVEVPVAMAHGAGGRGGKRRMWVGGMGGWLGICGAGVETHGHTKELGVVLGVGAGEWRNALVEVEVAESGAVVGGKRVVAVLMVVGGRAWLTGCTGGRARVGWWWFWWWGGWGGWGV